MNLSLHELQQQCEADSSLYFTDVNRFTTVQFHLLALAGEVGELCNDLKKQMRGDMDAHAFSDLAKTELPDILIYLLLLANTLGIDLEDAYEAKREFNHGRFIRHQ